MISSLFCFIYCDKTSFAIIRKMQVERLELSRSTEHRILSPMCLPIPPYPRYIKTIAGFEPASRRVAAYCLKPLGYIAKSKWTLKESNLRPLSYELSALTI